MYFKYLTEFTIVNFICFNVSNAEEALTKTSEEEIVVYASKEDETQFTLPSTSQVFSKTEIENKGLEDLSDIVERSPNLHFTDFTRNTPSISIRGIGFSDDEADSMSNGVYMDGIQIFNQGLGQLFDVEQVEILYGPQSDLYGQSSLGGVIAVQTTDPQFSWGHKTRFEYGSGNRYRLTHSSDIPLAEKTAIRLTLGYEEVDGFIENITLDAEDTAGWENKFGRIKLLHEDKAGGVWKLSASAFQSKGGNDHFASIRQ